MSEIRNVKCENKCNPLNVDVKHPRFSWQIASDEKNIFQKSYQIIVKENKNSLGQPDGREQTDIWDCL